MLFTERRVTLICGGDGELNLVRIDIGFTNVMPYCIPTDNVTQLLVYYKWFSYIYNSVTNYTLFVPIMCVLSPITTIIV